MKFISYRRRLGRLAKQGMNSLWMLLGFVPRAMSVCWLLNICIMTPLQNIYSTVSNLLYTSPLFLSNSRTFFNCKTHIEYREWVPYEFLLVVLHTLSISSSHCGASSWIVFEFQWITTYFGSLRAKLNLAPLGTPKCSNPQWTYIECPSLKPPHYFQACTSNLLNMEGVVCKSTNSWPKVLLS